MRRRILLTFLVAMVAREARAQTGARPDSAHATPPAPAVTTRASWLSDRLPLQVGDIVTVVVDEQTAAREKVSNVATGNRSQKGALRIDSGSATSKPTNIQVATGMNA